MWRNWLREACQTHTWESSNLLRAEWIFLSETGMTVGAAKHLPPAEQNDLLISLMANNTLATSEIEGDILDRDAVRATIRGRMDSSDETSPVASGLADLTVATVRTAHETFTESRLLDWHRAISGGASHGTTSIYRRSGSGEKSVRTGEPPPEQARKEIDLFLRWFGLRDGESSLSPLLKAGLAHLWFESIHPFPNGNGPIGRALAEIALIQGLPIPHYTPLSPVLLQRRQEYFLKLDGACRDRDITAWLTLFAAIVIESGRHCRARVDFAIAVTNLLSSLHGRIAERQDTALRRLYQGDRDDTAARLTENEYRLRANVDAETAKGDLAQLVTLGALTSVEGEEAEVFRLGVSMPAVGRVQIDEIL